MSAPALSFDDALGDELLPLVLAHLPLEDLCRVSRVCRRLQHAVLEAQQVWRQLFQATFPEGQQQQGQQGQQGQGQQGQEQQQQPGQQQGQEQQQQPGQQQQGQRGQQQQGQQQEAQRQQGGAPASASGSPQAPSGSLLSSLPPPVAAAGAIASGSKRKREDDAPSSSAAAAAAAAGGDRPQDGGGPVDWRQLFKQRFVAQARLERAKRAARRLRAESALQLLQRDVHDLEQRLAGEQRALPALRAELAAVRRAKQQATSARLAQLYWAPAAVQLAQGQVTDQTPQDAEAREQDLLQRLAVGELEVRTLKASLESRRRRAAEAQKKLQALLP